MNNAHLKLNSMSEFTALWNSGERFRKFAEQVYRYLERMKPGTVLALERYSGEQLEFCQFHDDGFYLLISPGKYLGSHILHRGVQDVYKRQSQTHCPSQHHCPQ